MKKFTSLFLLILVIYKVSISNENIPSSITENQITNIKVYTYKALNLSLNAYSELKSLRPNKKNTQTFLESALFFLNEASIYSPSYIIKKHIETLIKRMKNFPDENYKKDLISLKYEIESIEANLTDYDNVKENIDKILNNYTISKNKEVISELQKLSENINLPLIDNPLKDAKTFLAIAYDNLKASRLKKAKQSIEIALDPMIKLTSRENLYLVRFKNLIYYSSKAYFNNNIEISKVYLQLAKKFLQLAYKVSIDENKDMIKGFLNQINFIEKNFQNKPQIEKEFIIIVRQIKNL